MLIYAVIDFTLLQTELQSLNNNLEMLQDENKRIKEELDDLNKEVLSREV